MARYSRASLRLVLLAALTLPGLAAMTGSQIAASPALAVSPAHTLTLPPAHTLTLPLPLLPRPTTLPDRGIFMRAARRSGVPPALLLAVSYVQSFWGDHGGRPSIDGGYGLMDLVHSSERDTLDAAARLLHVSPRRVMRDDALNVLGGALLLAHIARALSPRHRLPATLGAWAAAIVGLTGMRTELAAEAVLRDVYGLLAHGLVRPGRSGRSLALAAMRGAAPDLRVLAPLHLRAQRPARRSSVDYPGAIWAPSPNYTVANRPGDLSVSYAVIHDTEGSCASALNWLDSPESRGSAHFLVCQDGTVYQLVRVRDIAWHAGNWYINQHSIGIEHEGFRDSGGYTQAQYDASAAILIWLDSAYGLNIPLDRNAIFGHENVPNATHTDPGPWWNWPYYMSLVRGGAPYDGGDPAIAMVAAPQVTLYACPDPSCAVLGTANWGEQFALAGVSDGWDGVYYNGAAAWVVASAMTAGAGARLRVTIRLLNVRDAPSLDGTVIGTIPRGQVYVSRLLDPSLDAAGWWLIAFNHRYGFISSHYVQIIGVPTAPVNTATATPFVPTATATSRPTDTSTPTAIPSPTASPTVTATATVSATATVTATATVSVTATGTVTAPVSGTITAPATAVPSATAPPPPSPTPRLPGPSQSNAPAALPPARQVRRDTRL